jgi:hypothetical protein
MIDRQTGAECRGGFEPAPASVTAFYLTANRLLLRSLPACAVHADRQVIRFSKD